MSGGAPINLTAADSFGQVVLDWGVSDTLLTVFTSNGTFTSDPNAVTFSIDVIAGGGGGGAGDLASAGTPGCGAGAGGGERGYGTGLSVALLPSTVAVTVGAGGVGASSTSVHKGTDGGQSSFGSFVVCNGGTGGLSNPEAGGSGGAGGTGGSTTLSGVSLADGGKGGDGANTFDTSGITAAPTTNSPSGGGGGDGHSAFSGSGGTVGSLAGGSGAALVNASPWIAQNGAAGNNASTGSYMGSGGGGGGCAVSGSTGIPVMVAGNGGNGGLYGAGGAGGGLTLGGITMSGGVGGNGAQGVVAVTLNYPAPLYYNIYRNGTLLTSTTQQTFTDTAPPPDLITYQVTAVYSAGESSPATVTIEISAPPTYGRFVSSQVYKAIEISQVGDIIPRIWPSKKNITVYA